MLHLIFKPQRLAILFLFLFIRTFCTDLFGQTLFPGFSSSVVSSGWSEPMGVAFTKSGNKMFVWEKGGKVYVCNLNTTTLTYTRQNTPVLNISEEVGNWSDYGLMGLALDPDFETNGQIYLLYVVDRHHLLNFGKSTYSSTADDYWNATIGRVTRYKTVVNGSGETTADLTTRKVLLGEIKSNGIPLLYNSHGLGMLVFADDKTLLISAGDAASYSMDDLGPNADSYFAQALLDSIIRPNENVGAFRAQMVNSYNGKILRIDPKTGDGVSSNPFYKADAPRSAQSRVWAMGFRNPFRFSIRPNSGSKLPNAGDVGEIYVGDVGYGAFEELHIIKSAGTNCGWPIYEGITRTPGPYSQQSGNVLNKDEPNPLFGLNGCTKQFFSFADLLKQATADGNTTVYNPCDPTKPITGSIGNRYFHRVPILDWAHFIDSARVRIFNGNNVGVAQIGTAASGVTGAPFRGSSVTGGCWYQGTMFPANYRNNYFFGDYVGNWLKFMTVESADQIRSVNPFASNLTGFIFLVENPLDGSLFAVDIGANLIRRISYGGNQPPVAKIKSDKVYGTTPLTVQFTGSDSYDTDGSSLTYLWEFGDGTTSTALNPAYQFATANNLPKKFVVKLTVKDADNATATDSIVISLNNTPPVVNIVSPVKNDTYTLGPDTTYTLRADVTDAEHGSSQLSYRWQVFLRHNTHEHPEPIDTNKISSARISRIGCNGDIYYWFFQLSVTDAAGLTTMDSVKLFPACATVPPEISSHPQSQTVCSGQQVTFSSTVTEPLVVTQIQWQRRSKQSVLWSDITGATESGYSFSVTDQDDSTFYRVAWSNSKGTTISDSALLLVKRTPVPPVGPSQQIFCFAATVGDLHPSGPSIKWYSASVSGRVLTETAPVTSGTHYFASQTVNGCESMDRLEVITGISASTYASVILNGSNSTGSITSYQWSMESGPNVPAIANANAAIATVTNLDKGVYIFRLSLNGGASTSRVLVNVNPSLDSIKVHAGFDRQIYLPASSMILDGNGSFGPIKSYLWSKVNGPDGIVITDNTSRSAQVSGLIAGDYAFELLILGQNNISYRDTVNVKVFPAPQPTAPVIDKFNPAKGTSNTVVNSLTGVVPGSLLVLSLAQADDFTSGIDPIITSSPVLTWTKRASAAGRKSGNASIWTAVFPAGGNISVTSIWGTQQISCVLYSLTNYDTTNAGAVAVASNQSAPSVAITTARPNSLVIGVSSDWKAVSGSTRVYRGGPTETFYDFKSGIYTGYHYQIFAGNAATYSLGLTSPTGMSAGTVLWEAQGRPTLQSLAVSDAGYDQTVFIATTPTGDSIQSFCGSASIKDLRTSAGNVRWFSSALLNDTVPLLLPVVNGNRYYASQLYNGCESYPRLEVKAVIETAQQDTADRSVCSSDLPFNWRGKSYYDSGLFSDTSYAIEGQCDSVYFLNLSVLPSPETPAIDSAKQCDGSYILSVNGGGKLQWNTGDTLSSLRITQAGTYSVTRTNMNGCSSRTLIGLSDLSLSFRISIQNKQDVLCFGDSTGRFAVSVQGGKAPFKYSLDNIRYDTAAVFSGLRADAYKVYVKDSTQCIVTSRTVIAEPASMLSMSINKSDVTVHGAETGTIYALGTGGAGGYRYKINDGSFIDSGRFIRLSAGTYNVFLLDSNECALTRVVYIDEPADDLSCTGNTWMGAVSTAWENPLNWSCGSVPTSNSDVVIPSNTLYQPVISSHVVIKSLLVKNSSLLTIVDGFSLKFKLKGLSQ